mmetsp:Transcript_311/g.2478  ORF Transcript_311/g.2478 Transcript_311/m.2478 type:complete len:281 (+) Transcript_311:315-1157(+)
MPRMEVSSLFDVRGKQVVVTGGGRGIGRMIAEGFAANGAKVILCSRNIQQCAASAEDINKKYPGTCASLQADLSTKTECERLAERIGEVFKEVHVLVNNSGTSWGAPLEETPDMAWDKVLALNVKAPFHLTVALLPLLDKGSKPNDPARVINIGSSAGIRPQAFPTFAYDTSKAAINFLTQKLSYWLARRTDKGGHSITVNSIAPGYVPTKMSKQLGTYGMSGDRLNSVQPLPRTGGAEDMAGAAIFLASRAGAWVTGIVLVVDGGLLATPPGVSLSAKL